MHLTVMVWALLAALGAGQFQFFEQMFHPPPGHGHHEQHDQGPQNVPSDSERYQRSYNEAHCTNYLCPRTLACVHFPHHCPCAFPAYEDKVELADGSAICISKGGLKVGEAAAKIELARKGLL